MLGKGTLHLSKMPGSWISPPGVIYGCRLSVYPGLSLSITRGKVVTANSFAVEILEDIPGAVQITPASSNDRMDYVVLTATENGADILYLIGEKPKRTLNQLPCYLQNGVLLAKVYVTYPTIGPESIYVFNATPARGEPIFISVRPTAVPNGVNKRFIFPTPCPSRYALKVRVWGVLQTEGIDYSVSVTGRIPGIDAAIVTFDEAPPAGADISADIYAGSVQI